MGTHRQRLGELLVAKQLITSEQLLQALNLQQKQFEPLGRILVQQGSISEEHLLQACAHQKGVAAWFLNKDAPEPDALACLPGQLCRTQQVLPVRIQNGRLILAMRDPGDLDALDMARNVSGKRIEPVLASEERLVQAIELIHGSVDLLHNWVRSCVKLCRCFTFIFTQANPTCSNACPA